MTGPHGSVPGSPVLQPGSPYQYHAQQDYPVPVFLFPDLPLQGNTHPRVHDTDMAVQVAVEAIRKLIKEDR